MNTDFPPMCTPNLCKLFKAVSTGCRIATYSDVRKPFLKYVKEQNINLKWPMNQVPANVDEDQDRFSTSWSVNLGHHFFVWVKGSLPSLNKSKKK